MTCVIEQLFVMVSNNGGVSGKILEHVMLGGVVSEILTCFFFFSSRRRHTRFDCDWSSDVCSSDLLTLIGAAELSAISLETLWFYWATYFGITVSGNLL